MKHWSWIGSRSRPTRALRILKKLGEKVASSLITVVDDPTLPQKRGSYALTMKASLLAGPSWWREDLERISI